MKFYLTDRVLELERGKRLVALKNLTLAEEYLQDHFPAYPVSPGVLMIDALIQAAAWLHRATTDFAQSVVVLDEARNVKYGAFFKPGTSMRITVECLKQEPGLWSFKGLGQVDDQETVKGRFTLRAFNLADSDPGQAEADRVIIAALRQRWSVIAAKVNG